MQFEMLKIVNLPIFLLKKVNLPISNWGMNRLLLLFWCLIIFTACNKVDDPAVINSGQAEIDEKIITDYISANGLGNRAARVKNIAGRPDTIGIYYVIEKESNVATLYSLSSSVTLGYTGRLLTTGKEFASTGDIHPSFVLGNVIKGWQLGIPNVNKGGIIRLFIPSRHAYGPYKQPVLDLPANAVLDFTIEVFDVTN